jgi:hypothetical protein
MILDLLPDTTTLLVFVLVFLLLVAYVKARRPENFPPGPEPSLFTGTVQCYKFCYNGKLTFFYYRNCVFFSFGNILLNCVFFFFWKHIAEKHAVKPVCIGPHVYQGQVAQFLSPPSLSIALFLHNMVNSML